MTEMIPETEKDIPEKNGTETLVENTNFLVDFVSSHKNTFFSEEGFLYAVTPGVDARKWLLDILDSIVKQEYLIEDFQSARIEQFLHDPVFLPWENDKIRIGKSIRKMDFEAVKKYSGGIIRNTGAILYEYMPNRPFVGARDFFLSILWFNGVRAGIQMEEVENAIKESGNTTKKFTVAKRIESIPPKDADIRPMAQILRSKKIKTPSESGNADLHEYECVFPEVTEKEWIGFKLIKKEPMVEGIEGIEIDGTILKTKAPTDKDIRVLVGTGVHVIKEDAVEYIVADRLGFISFDPKTKQISITDEINNPDPIGPKTGNIEVAAEIFRQHTHIDHGYRLIGNTIQMIGGLMGGTIISREWDITIAQTVTEGGKVTAQLWNISIGAKVLGGKIEAFGGKITVPYAENSVLIAHEIEIGEAVHCTLIADIITIKNSRGSSFFGKKVHIHHADFSGDFDHDIKGIVYIHDNLIARKTIRAMNNLKNDIQVLTGGMRMAHEELIRNGFEAAKPGILAKKKSGGTYTEHEQALVEKYTLYARYRKRKEEQEAVLSWLISDNPEIEDMLRYLETDNSENTGLVIDSITYSPWTTKEMSEKRAKNMPAIFFDLNIELYSAHDIPCYLSEMTSWPRGGKNYFVDMANRLTLWMIRNDARIHPFHSTKSSEWTMNLDYTEMSEYIRARKTVKKGPASKEVKEKIPRAENRVSINSIELIHAIRKDPDIAHKAFCIPVDIDGRYRAFIQDFSGGGVCLILDMNQKYMPIFENFEEFDIEFEVNKVIHKQSLIVTNITETEDRIIRIGWYYANLSEESSNALYRSKNFLELALEARTEKT